MAARSPSETVNSAKFEQPGRDDPVTFRQGVSSRLILVGVVFVLLSAVFVHLLGSPFAPDFSSASGLTRLLEQALALGWWLLGARLTAILVRAAIRLGSPSREARILSDLAGGLIAVAAALAVIAFVFALPVRGLLATSGVIAIVLGLALQNTLGDLFAGLAVGVERPYGPGDRLTVDGTAGVVTEINWRSTHLSVGRDVAVIPNSVVARAHLLNRSGPSLATVEQVEIDLDPAIPPEEGLAVLDAALQATAGLAPGYAPTVGCSRLAGDRTTFTLEYTVPNVDSAGPVRTALFARVHRHLRFAGLHLACPGTEPPPTPARGSNNPADIAVLLARSDLFGAMIDAHRDMLACQFELLDLAVGEIIFSEGDRPEALFIIASGTIEMVTGALEAPSTCYRLSPGETIAAVALITGQPQRATARSVTAARMYRLDEAALAASLADRPELEADLERTVERAVRAMARQRVLTVDTSEDTSVAFGHRLRLFLGRLRSLTAGR